MAEPYESGSELHLIGAPRCRMAPGLWRHELGALNNQGKILMTCGLCMEAVPWKSYSNRDCGEALGKAHMSHAVRLANTAYVIVGKVNPRQHRITSDRQKYLQQQENSAMQDQGAYGEDYAELTGNTTAILAELCAGFKAINARFHMRAGCMDCMGKHLDEQATRLAQTKDRISKIEDAAAKVNRRLEVLEAHLHAVAIKNEDLESRS
ncbi:hypothetical protein NDU88_004069 [Pleurodeles waltl]|uniref:Uncharacterized protein n=1 Tax=Pleurodeles waltl TaxID=8319 RepID=A0AAV7VIV7_PLEWA|nr:hypothetical protein NDU88_004069 [Pleurodeles waltl]